MASMRDFCYMHSVASGSPSSLLGDAHAEWKCMVRKSRTSPVAPHQQRENVPLLLMCLRLRFYSFSVKLVPSHIFRGP